MTKYNTRSGFTLVELMLAMTFLSILMVAIAIITIQVSQLYQKGQTMTMINRVARELSDSIKRDSLSLSDTMDIFVQPDANNGGLGRLCLGGATYLWTDGDMIRNQANFNPTRYVSATGQEQGSIMMARVVGTGKNYCEKQANGRYNTRVVQDENTTELLRTIERGEFAVSEVSWTKLTDRLFRLTFTLGTNRAGTIEKTVGSVNKSCVPPGTGASDFNFCSVNTFDMVVSAGGVQ